jgi:hypothetical protein
VIPPQDRINVPFMSRRIGIMQTLRTMGFSAALLALGALAAPSVASAGDGYRYGRGHPGRGWGPPPRAYYAPPPRYYYAPPPRAYYAPPPRVYYAPPPVYYAPPRPYYGRPGVSLNFRF